MTLTEVEFNLQLFRLDKFQLMIFILQVLGELPGPDKFCQVNNVVSVRLMGIVGRKVNCSATVWT